MNTDYIIPPTAQKTRYHTDRRINERIREHAVQRLRRLDPKQYSRHIRALDVEWDVERVLELNAASIVLLSTFLGLKKHKGWFVLGAAAAAFLAAHALHGWCPPLPWLRDIGIRSEQEIFQEKTAVKFLRGDFQKANPKDVRDLLERIEKN